jgi:hypothetical protein
MNKGILKGLEDKMKEEHFTKGDLVVHWGCEELKHDVMGVVLETKEHREAQIVKVYWFGNKRTEWLSFTSLKPDDAPSLIAKVNKNEIYEKKDK